MCGNGHVSSGSLVSVAILFVWVRNKLGYKLAVESP